MKFSPNCCGRTDGKGSRPVINPGISLSIAQQYRRGHWIRTIAILLALYASGVNSKAASPVSEVELTAELLSAVAPKLSNPTLAAQLDIIDRLVFGKGNIVRVEGKSRRYFLLALDRSGKQLVKLFDLSSLDLNDTHLKGWIYFNGVLSKIEQTQQGTIEVTVTYARLSSGPGHAYSIQAETFVRRYWESKRQNQEIQNQGTQSASGSTAGPPQASTTAPAAGSKDNVSTDSRPQPSVPVKVQAGVSSAKPDKTEGEDEPDDSEEPVKNKPILLRRDRIGTPAPSSSSNGKPTTAPPGVNTQSEQDVVIYRKKTDVASSAHSLGGKSQEAQPLKNELDGMVLIPEGYVTLGSNEPLDKEKPLHRVFVQAFYIDQYEVTNREYKKFCDATGHATPHYWQGQNLPKDFARHPAAYVMWQDAMAYAKWAGKRLPTEAEWERAAKGPNSYRYTYGNAYDPQKANTESKATTPAGSYAPSEFGLYDMTGNLAEWTSSLFRPYPYKGDDGREDVQAPGHRVLRGGSNSSGESNARCLVRAEGVPDEPLPSVGFRCARDAN
jgi:formylglycine-generating enzyme required for sulfatase activity